MTERPEGNGAREALEEIFDKLADDDDSFTPNLLLLMLAERGYVIKPLVEH